MLYLPPYALWAWASYSVHWWAFAIREQRTFVNMVYSPHPMRQIAPQIDANVIWLSEWKRAHER